MKKMKKVIRTLLRILNNWRYLHFKHKWVFVKSQGVYNYHFCDKCPTMLITSLYHKPKYVRGFEAYRKFLEFKNFEWECLMHYYDTNNEKLAKIYSKKWGRLSDIKHHWKWKYDLPLIRLKNFIYYKLLLMKDLYKYIHRETKWFIRSLIPKLSPRYFKSKKNLSNLKTSMNGFVEPSNYIHFVDPDLLKGNEDTIVTLVKLPYTDWEIDNIKIVDEIAPNNK